MQTLDVKIEKIISGGYGLSRISEEKVLFIPFTIPGEMVRIEIVNEKKNYAFGKVLDIINPSPKRKLSKCPLFGYCGGCQFQMLEYNEQIEIKRRIIEESIIRIGKLTIPVLNPVISDLELHYRNKGSFQVFGKSEIGFCKPGTTIPFPISECPLMEEPINRMIRNFMNIETERSKLSGMKALVIRSNFEGEAIDSTKKRDSFVEKVAGLNFIIDVDTFFQINRTIIPKWLEYIKQVILSHNAGNGLLDLYSGVGTISQYLSPYYEKVIGIEVNKRLVENGLKVLEMNDINNVEYLVGDASNFYDIDYAYDTIIINPPRKGISYKMVKSLINANCKLIIYSSCNSDTFARDVRQLTEGGYQIDQIMPFDMFPQTQHTEVVGILYKK